ncbi:MAG: DnaJ domain-containing protein [Acidimicrobiia bacterium]|nr:DnaJ domain-containing protein [Acidimicrobiia bacterium]
MDYLEEELRKALRVAEQSHADDNIGSGWRPGAMSVPQAHLILGTTPESAWSEITRAYRNKVKEVHPDQASGSIAKDDEFIKLVNLAMDTLKSTQSGG